jgi:autotransporter-associated beta strand protein
MPCERQNVKFINHRLGFCVLLAAAILLMSSSVTLAASYYWNVASGDWSDAANWKTGIEPTSSDKAWLTNGGTATITQSGEVCSYLYLGAADTGTIEMTSGSLSLSGSSYIGYSGTGTFTQYDGTNSISVVLYLGYNSGSTGSYNLRDTGKLSAAYEYIGKSSTGMFTQTGGTNSISSGLYLGNDSGSSGTYDLSGTGQLSANTEYFGFSGTGTFNHIGGTNTASYLYLGYFVSSGTYNLSETGQLSAVTEYIGYYGAGTFNQTGGSNTASYLFVSYDYESSGVYNLSGTGQLSADYEYIGYYGTGIIAQTGGTNTAHYLEICADANYRLTGGILNINGGFNNQGTMDLSNSSAVININSSIVNLSGAILATGGNATLNIDAHSLLIVPNGVDPAMYFTYFNNAGVIHHSGSTLDILSTYSIYGIGSIDDYVNCQGTLSATSGYYINLNGGLNVSGAGSVDLGYGTLYVNDANSEMSGGSLQSNVQHVGSEGTGTFTQNGGINSISWGLYLGYNFDTNGTYDLSGTGELSAYDEHIGVSGTGTFNQTGGTNTASYLYLGYFVSSGTYNLSDSGQLSSANTEYIGLSGTGMFNQTGGSNTTSKLYLGYNSGSSGMYDLSGTGNLFAESEEIIGLYGTGTFTQTGGANSITNYLCLGYSSDASGTYNLSNTGQLSADYEYFGLYGGTGTFTQTGGKNNINYALYLGCASGASGTYNLNGGTLILKSLSVGFGTATFNFGGGTLQASDNFTCSLPMILTGINGNANVDTAGYAVTLSGVLSGDGGLNKLGLGTLTLAVDATYTGDTTVEEGTLDVLNINTPTAAVSVAAGANELTAVSIISNSLTIGSGAKVTIKPITAGSLGSAITPVPEPGTLILLAMGCLWLFTYFGQQHQKRRH